METDTGKAYDNRKSRQMGNCEFENITIKGKPGKVK